MGAEIVDGEVLVYFKGKSTEDEIRQFVESLNFKLGNAFARSSNGYIVEVPTGEEARLADLLKTKKDMVETAAPNYVRRVSCPVKPLTSSKTNAVGPTPPGSPGCAFNDNMLHTDKPNEQSSFDKNKTNAVGPTPRGAPGCAFYDPPDRKGE